MNRFRYYIFWTLTSRISPLAYLLTYVSWVIGLFFGVFDFLPDVQHSLLHQYGIIGNPRAWGFGLLAFSTVLFVGIRTANRALCRFGAMGNFVLWTFAAILYIRHEFWYAFFSFALFHMLAQGYMYLVAALDDLWRERVK